MVEVASLKPEGYRGQGTGYGEQVTDPEISHLSPVTCSL